MNRARFLSLGLAAMASGLFAGAAEARGGRGKRASSESSSSNRSSGGTTVIVPGGSNRSSSAKEDCTKIADPGRRHDCAVKQIGR